MDTAKLPLGGRKPTDAVPSELSKLSPEQTLGGKDGSQEQGKPKAGDSSLKIKIELDLDIEVHLTARIKGDITIGLL